MINQKTSLVSIVIPCYNQARFLGEAVESVLAQTHPHFEIVVVDDGSSDNTSEVAARYPKVSLIRQKNQGLSNARNAGLRQSKGDFIVFLDADDRLLPKALEIGLKHLVAHPEWAFVSGRCALIASDGSPLHSVEQPYFEKDHYAEMLRDNYIWPPSVVLYRRTVFDTVPGFDTSLSGSADYGIYLQIAGRFPVGCHPHVISEYRQHTTNMSQNFGLMLKDALNALRSNWDCVRGNKQYEEAYKTGINFCQEYYGELLVERLRSHVRGGGDWMPALKGMLVLLRYSPRVFARHAGRKLNVIVRKASYKHR